MNKVKESSGSRRKQKNDSVKNAYIKSFAGLSASGRGSTGSSINDINS
ncbi:MAG: hypothetical protein ACR2IS_11325 [Nitrososphaeraceae archaeon]